MMNSELSGWQRENRARLGRPAPRSERAEHREASDVPELRKPARVHEERRVVVNEMSAEDLARRKEMEERLQFGERYEHLKETERRALEQTRRGWELGQELEQRLAADGPDELTEAEFQKKYWNPLADIRADLMNLQSYAQTLPEGARRKALMATIYNSIATIENSIHEGELEMHRRDEKRRREAVEKNWSLKTVTDPELKALANKWKTTAKEKKKKPRGFFARLKAWFD